MLFYMPDTMLDPENEMSEEGDSPCPHGVLLKENSMSQVAITTVCVDGYDAGQSTGGPGDTPQVSPVEVQEEHPRRDGCLY